MQVQPVSLDAVDAAELGELLEFLDQWLAGDSERVAASLTCFIDGAGYGLGELRADLTRFAGLLGATNVSMPQGDER
jgi:hypothetical protein